MRKNFHFLGLAMLALTLCMPAQAGRVYEARTFNDVWSMLGHGIVPGTGVSLLSEDTIRLMTSVTYSPAVTNSVPFYGRDISLLIRDITDAKLNNNNALTLTRREQEVIRACCDGLQGKEVADRLHISLRAVNSHKTNIFNKLGISSSLELVRFALEHGII